MRSQNEAISKLGQIRVCSYALVRGNTRCLFPTGSNWQIRAEHLGGSGELGAGNASWSEPSPVTRGWQLLDPGLYVGLAVSDQVVNLDVLWPVSDKPPATEASQANLKAR
jgi:hypothetical protein